MAQRLSGLGCEPTVRTINQHFVNEETHVMGQQQETGFMQHQQSGVQNQIPMQQLNQIRTGPGPELVNVGSCQFVGPMNPPANTMMYGERQMNIHCMMSSRTASNQIIDQQYPEAQYVLMNNQNQMINM